MSKINETNYPRRTQANYADTDMLIIQAAGGNTYTTRIEDLRDDCQETMAPIVGAINDALAPAENGSTASQSYAIGEHFMRNGDFCTAIAAITSGASFTLNTNYVVGTIAEALESLNSDLTNIARVAIVGNSSKYTVVQNQHYQESYTLIRGGFVFVNLLLNCVTPASNWEIVVPDSNFPNVGAFSTINPPGMVSDSTNDQIYLLIQLGHLYAKGGTAGKTYGVSFVYPAASS